MRLVEAWWPLSQSVQVRRAFVGMPENKPKMPALTRHASAAVHHRRQGRARRDAARALGRHRAAGMAERVHLQISTKICKYLKTTRHRAAGRKGRHGAACGGDGRFGAVCQAAAVGRCRARCTRRVWANGTRCGEAAPPSRHHAHQSAQLPRHDRQRAHQARKALMGIRHRHVLATAPLDSSLRGGQKEYPTRLYTCPRAH